MCLFPEENQQPVLGSNRFSEEKWQFSLDVKQKLHIFPTKIDEKIAKVSPSNNNYSSRKNHSTTRNRRGADRGFLERFLFVRDFSSEDFMWAAEGAAHAGAAKRRRERRHRAYLKYARMSVAMALSEYKHHTSRGQRMDRAGGGRGGTSSTVRSSSGASHPPGGRHWVLFLGRRRCACRRVAAWPPRWRQAAGAGSAAPRGPNRRHRACAADSWRPCAADGRTAGGRPPFLWYVVFCCRAGYRRARDRPRGHPCATLVSRTAAGGGWTRALLRRLRPCWGRGGGGGAAANGSWVSRSWCSWPFMVPGCGPGGDVLVDDRHIHCTVHLPGGDHRQARAVFKYWPSRWLSPGWCGDVPVTMQRQFQQFFEFFVCQVQFLDRMVDIPVMLGLQWQKTVEDPQLPWGRAMLCSTVGTYSASVQGRLLE